MNYTVTDLIPQRPPFVMIDQLVSCTVKEALTELTVRADNIFTDDGHLSPSGLMENMAQSCAARMGYLSATGGEAIKIGFIGNIRGCHFSRLPKVGEVLQTYVHVIEDVLNITLVETEVKVNGETIASSELKIALIDQ